MLLNQFHESESGDILEFNSRDVHVNDVSGMQLELLAREAVHITC